MKQLGLSFKNPLSHLTNLIVFSFIAFNATGHTSNAIYLSHDQYAVTYVGADNNDIVGVWDPWYPTEDTTLGTFSYRLIDSKNGTYAINSSSGAVTIKDNSKLVAGTDVLIIRTTLQGKYQDCKLYITVKLATDCKFIDPSASENGIGTRTSPYNSWGSVTFAAGKAYFQKRGTLWKKTIDVNVTGSKGKEIYLGAYGTGKRPEVSVDIASTGISVNGSFIRIFEFYIALNNYGIYKGHGSASNGYKVYTDLMFSDLTFYKNHTNNGQLDLSRTMSVTAYPDYQQWRIKVLDVSAYGAPNGYGIKVEGGYDTRLENIKTYDNEGWGVSLTWGVYNDTIVGLLSYNNLNGAVELSGKYCDISHSILKGATGKSVIVVDDPDASNTRIHHCIVKGGGVKGSIVLDAYSTVSEYSGWGPGHDFIIEDNIISGATGENAGIIIYYGTYNVFIQRNIIRDCPYGVNIGRYNDGIKNINIQNNLMHSLTNKAILGTGGSNIYIYNNTIDGSIDLTNTTNEEVRNNYFRSITSASIATNNIDIDTIKTAYHFEDFIKHNFRLKSTAKSVIGKGYNVGILYDFYGVRYGEKCDIGAIAYTTNQETTVTETEVTEQPLTNVNPEPDPFPNMSPVIADQFFTISEGSNSDNTVGKIVASDPDAEQKIQFSILSGNSSGIFLINSQTGTLSTTSGKVFGPATVTFELVVKATDNATEPKSASAKVTVRFVGKSTTVYINPENTNDILANGSAEHPFDSWNDVAWKEGYTYLQKRGTKATTNKILIGASKVSLGAYGEGDLPVISSTTNTYLISGFEKSGIKIKDLNLQATNAVSCIYFLGNSDDTITIEHCELVANINAIKVVDGIALVTKYNTITSKHEGIYSTAISNEIYYNIFKSCNTAVNLVSKNSKANIYNNVFYDNEKSLSVTYAELTLYNNIFYMTSPGQMAVSHGTGIIDSDHNIFYPEQAGFVTIANMQFDKLEQLQKDLKIDINSFNTDPLFVDIYNENFSVQASSPAINGGVELMLGIDFAGGIVPRSGCTDIGIREFEGVILPSKKPTEESVMTLYPNPSSGKVNIMAKTQQDLLQEDTGFNQSEIKVVGISGNIVFTKLLENQNNSTIQDNLDLTGLSNGLYFVILQIADKVIKEKLILNK